MNIDENKNNKNGINDLFATKIYTSMDIEDDVTCDIHLLSKSVDIDEWGCVKLYRGNALNGDYIGYDDSGDEIEYEKFRYEYVSKTMRNYTEKRYVEDFRSGIYIYIYIIFVSTRIYFGYYYF